MFAKRYFKKDCSVMLMLALAMVQGQDQNDENHLSSVFCHDL